jgi:hypothetical protein
MLIAFQLCTQEPSMTVRSIYRKRRILPGFLLVLLMVLGQTIATPTLASPTKSADISHVCLNSSLLEVFSSPQNPPYAGDDLCYILDNENDDDPQNRFCPAHAVDHFLFEHSGATSRNSHPLSLTVTSGNSYRLTAVYMLTERFRL